MYKVRKYSLKSQYIISILLILVTSFFSYFTIDYMGHRAVALMFLLVVSILAMLFDIFPVLLTALLSALIWNFFFIPPKYTFHIETPEDALMFLMYFVVALINVVLTFKIREFEKKSRDKEERETTIMLYNTLLNSLSHELKTPISTIIGAIDTILQTSGKLSHENRYELYYEIEIAGERLNRQVENLLSMSRLDAGFLKPKLDWCDLNELIFAVINDHKDGARDHEIIFHPDEDLPLFKIDRGLIAQALYNILHNAIIHTPKNSVINIAIEEEEDYCLFVISDNGPGFPEKEMRHVFDKFYRLSHSIGGGTGLGLSIAKGFIEAHNGTIHLENLKAGGARFSIVVPAEKILISQETHE